MKRHKKTIQRMMLCWILGNIVESWTNNLFILLGCMVCFLLTLDLSETIYNRAAKIRHNYELQLLAQYAAEQAYGGSGKVEVRLSDDKREYWH